MVMMTTMMIMIMVMRITMRTMIIDHDNHLIRNCEVVQGEKIMTMKMTKMMTMTMKMKDYQNGGKEVFLRS